MEEFQHEAILIPGHSLSKLKTYRFERHVVSVLRHTQFELADLDQQRMVVDT
jgi:hypothetical protein